MARETGKYYADDTLQASSLDGIVMLISSNNVLRDP